MRHTLTVRVRLTEDARKIHMRTTGYIPSEIWRGRIDLLQHTPDERALILEHTTDLKTINLVTKDKTLAGFVVSEIPATPAEWLGLLRDYIKYVKDDPNESDFDWLNDDSPF
ncbi:hypothetical protein [Deinococcus frigens]|uniref:hypothetical protein n=1 Tax=Deinococcus frigens TaxID=249403 RepID=UPI00138E22C0|nr:hypothetical protein [Deinococcus frigens]